MTNTKTTAQKGGFALGWIYIFNFLRFRSTNLLFVDMLYVLYGVV